MTSTAMPRSRRGGDREHVAPAEIAEHRVGVRDAAQRQPRQRPEQRETQ
ncbi:hypothetical protein WJ973_08115 [Achromobacter xylosoxidans]